MAENWSEEELRASVAAYVDMQRKQAKGEPFVKKNYYRELSGQYGRTEKAYEYRMQNISFVYSLQGRDWVEGLKPARNVGSNVIQVLERVIADVEGQSVSTGSAFQVAVNEAKKKQADKPAGNAKPSSTTASVTQFVRDPKVVAWVLNAANGVCECCEKPAPFVKEDGTPYLEVHHIQRLADGGADTVENAVAICPNCHMQLHYGEDKKMLAQALRKRVPRLSE